ncbi:MAG TPA: heme-binding protein [Chthoniobacter sp.]|jgi:putative heme-binding domain-containing protein
MKFHRLIVPFAAACVVSSLTVRAAEKTWLDFAGKDGPGKGKHVVLLAGDEEYRSEESMPMLAKILSQRLGFDTTVLFSVEDDGRINPNKGESLSHPEALDSADAIVMSLRFRHWPDEAMAHFDKAYLRGVPFVALRTSTHAFDYKKDSKYAKYAYNFGGPEWVKGFGRQILGETWVNHWGKHKSEATRGIIEPSAKDDPVLRGVTDLFGLTDVYEAKPTADAKILVRGQVVEGMTPDAPPADYSKARADKVSQGINDPMMPVVWTREVKNEDGKTNRVLATTMGAATDLQNEGLRRLVINGVLWGLGMEVPAKTDVTIVDEYKPSFFGFIKDYFKDGRGLKVSDLELGKAMPGEPTAQPKPKPAEPKKSAKADSAEPLPGSELLKQAPRPARPALAASKLPLEFISGERIAFVGNSLAEHFSKYGYFETLLHSRFPKLELVVRNFARPADEVAIRQRSANYTALDDPLAAFGPDTFFCFFGYNESFAGPEGVPRFISDYEKFLADYARKYPRDETKAAPRFVLVSPIAFETPTDQFLPDGKKENANLKLYAAAVGEVARRQGLAFVDLFDPTSADFSAKAGLKYTTNGAQTNEAGDRRVAELLDRALFGTSNPAKIGSPAFERLRAAINDKSWVHQQDYRMLNGWYVYGGRRTFDTQTFPREFLKIRAMAAVRDRYLWDIVQGRKVAAKPDDSKTGVLFVPPTGAGRWPTKEPKELKYPTPEEAIASMKVPDGFEVQLVASEREFPELAKVDQISFDNKGRLWASCMPTYPQWKPGDPRPNDKLIIFDKIDAKGKAHKATVFYDKLTCPTGFEFWNGGVIVVDEPRLIFLKDTDGDDKADQVVELIDGWATDDTHHCINAFQWSPGGLLNMLEGVSVSTAVETPWGPFRRSGAPGCYVFDPRTEKLRHFVTPGYGNPWCYAYNWWGQGIVGDGTTPQQHWDTPLSGAEFPGRKGMNTVFDGEGMRPNVGTEFIYSRQFPDDVQGNFIFACTINMNGLTTFHVGDDGAGYKGARRKKTVTDENGKQKLVPDDLLTAVDNMTFRPTNPQIGPDGALYFGDWSAALLGHMQYSQRDPNRDHTHGRIYRLVYKNKPLLTPVTQYGKPLPELLDQLKEYEPRTRYRARRELRDRPTPEVLAAINKWVAKLTPTDKDFDRLLLEALWVEQGHHAVDPFLLQKVLHAKTGEARAGATRVLADEWDRIPNAMELVKQQVVDEFPRTRVEAIRALSFVPTKESVEAVLEAVNLPRDYWIDYTLQMTLGALEPVWKPALQNKQIALNNPKGLEFLNELDQSSKPSGMATAALKRYLTTPELKQKDRDALYHEIAKARGVADNGKAVFRRICVACHKFGSEGIEYGPQMDGVATRLKREDIIESVLDPNAKIAPGFLTTNVETQTGAAFSGFVIGDTPETLTLRIAGGLKQEIKVADIKKRENIKQSSMPEGLANGMSPGEFLDLIEFLSSLKAAQK